jgi:hypothetical protein
VDRCQRLLRLDAIPLSLGVDVLGLPLLLLHRSEELAHLKRAQASGLLPAIARQLILRGVEGDALQGDLVQSQLHRLLTEPVEKPDKCPPHQALRGVEFAMNRKRAEPLVGPRDRVLQGCGEGERSALARVVRQEPDRLASTGG